MYRFSTSSAEKHVGRRARARVRLAIPAKLVLLGRTASCRLEDLSTTGARVSLEDPPHGMSEAVLLCPGIDQFCVIAWSHGSQCGLLFEDPLPHETVIALRHLANANSERDQQTRENRRFAQEWAGGFGRKPGGN